MQRETKLVGKPFCDFLHHLGWFTVKLHGDQYQKGLPDIRAMHPQYGGRWIEFKVIDSGSVHLTPAQISLWPTWISHGEKIFVVCAESLEGPQGIPLMRRWYNQICIGQPNAHLLLHRSTRQFGIYPEVK